MAIPSFPAINQNACSGWLPQDRNLYNKLPAWFFAKEVQFRRNYGSYKRIFGRQKWEANKGSTMTGIVVEPPPQRRQFAFPAAVASAPAKKDIIQHRERSYNVGLVHHKFESPIFQWVPSFEDFLTNKIPKSLQYVLKWQEDFQSIYYRGQLFHQSPWIGWCNHETTPLDQGPVGFGNDSGTSGKTDAYMQSMWAGMGTPGTLTLENLWWYMTALEEDIGATPYESGSIKDDQYLNDKFLCMLSAEAYNRFINDPWTKEMKAFDLNLVTDGFKGMLFGRITCSLHSNPLRFDVDDDTGEVSWPAPETTEENPDAENFGQTIRNPAYNRARGEVCFLVGGQAYDIVEPGPPPGDFSSKANLQWNGRPMLTDDILIKCTDDDDNVVYEPNRYGEFLQIISMAVMGIAGVTKRNVLPIVFARSRRIDTSLQ